MGYEDKDVELLDRRGGVRRRAELRIWEESPADPASVKLAVLYDHRVVEAESEVGFFDAMCDVRRQLEKDGLLLVCLGASRSVYPSGMARTMGSGDRAYRINMGTPAAAKDLVSIFDTGPDADPATLEEQEQFFRAWLASLQST